MVRGAGVASWVHRLLDFCAGLLERGCVLPGQDEDEEDGSTVRSQPRVSAAAYSAVLEGALRRLLHPIAASLSGRALLFAECSVTRCQKLRSGSRWVVYGTLCGRKTPTFSRSLIATLCSS